MSFEPRYSIALYHHLAEQDRPTNAEIDNAFTRIDQIPNIAGVEVFSGSGVTVANAAHVKKRLDERGLSASMVHHGEPYIRSTLLPPGTPGRAARRPTCA